LVTFDTLLACEDFMLRASKMLLPAMMLVLAAASGPASSAEIEILLDRAQVFKVPAETKTLIIGNPGIADVSIIKTGLMVVTGKSFGLTNIVALDKDGRQLADTMVSVKNPEKEMLTVMRGDGAETLYCPEGNVCTKTVTLGDSNETFGQLLGQIPQRQNMGGAPAPVVTAPSSHTQ
jgi:hypothetical protein